MEKYRQKKDAVNVFAAGGLFYIIYVYLHLLFLTLLKFISTVAYTMIVFFDPVLFSTVTTGAMVGVFRGLRGLGIGLACGSGFRFNGFGYIYIYIYIFIDIDILIYYRA